MSVMLVLVKNSKNVVFGFLENFVDLQPLGNVEFATENFDAILNGVDEDEVADGTVDDYRLIIMEPSLFLDEKLTDILSSISVDGSVFMLFIQNVTGGIWFEYHEQGMLKRQWVEIESVIQSNLGASLNDLDATIFADSSDENEPRDPQKALELAEDVMGIKFDKFSGIFNMYEMHNSGQ